MADKSLKLVIITGFIILVTLLLLSEFIVSNSYKRISAADLVLWRISNVIHHLIAYAQPEEEDEEADDEDEDNIAVLDNRVDKFGIEKLYPTKTDGEEWYMNM